MVVSHFMSHPIRLTISTIKLVCTWHIITSHVFQVSPAQGPSMLPTFSVKGDWVAADMTHARNRRGQLRVGDLVLYRIPVSDNANGIKRLIGLPGDYVSMNTPGSPGEERMIQVGSPIPPLCSFSPLTPAPIACDSTSSQLAELSTLGPRRTLLDSRR
jgi:inner membrane protease subunit 1